jgi:ABC-type dipeptide/oligopeptide/nickel transport system permease subunit
LKAESISVDSRAVAGQDVAPEPAGRRVLKRLLRSRSGLSGIIIIAVIALSAIFAPLLSPYDPLAIHKGEQFQAPSATYLFGSDEFGRDIFSRTLYAGRISLIAGAFAVAVAALIGVPLGLISGYAGGLTDTMLMRTMDSLLAFPAILLALAIVAVLGPSSLNAMIAVAIVSIPNFARIARAAMLTQKEMDYVLAARSLGAPAWRIVFRAILPNSLAPILVQITLAVAFAILIEAALSFLGLGTQPPDASWGAMLFAARSYLRRAWWYGVFPGLFITVLVLGLNNLAEALRDALDPTHQAH